MGIQSTDAKLATATRGGTRANFRSSATSQRDSLIYPPLPFPTAIPRNSIKGVHMRRLTFIALASTLATLPIAAQHDHGKSGDKLGAVSFSTSCAPAVEQQFNTAIAMLHSFWFDEANKTFTAVASADTSCAMAHWGVAMTAWGNPFVRQPIGAEQQRRGLAAAERAADLSARASHREQMYMEAALALWRDADKVDHLVRLGRHEAAMKKLYET